MENVLRELSRMGLSKDALIKVSLLLDRTVSGNDKVLLSPIADQLGPNRILEGWDSIFKAKESKLNEVLLDLEMNNRSKYGPRSIAIPWSERSDSVYDSFKLENSDIMRIEHKPKANHRLRPISEVNAKSYIKRSTSAGLPYMVKKGSVLDSGVKLDQTNKWPAVLFTRTQENKKTRTVWGINLDDVLEEMCFYRPILDLQKLLPWRAALRKADDIDEAITNLIRYATLHNLKLVSIDFSNYDNSVKVSGHKWVFDVYFGSLFQKQYSGKLSLLQDRFTNVPLLTPASILSGSHGIPSGSAFTNEVGSVWQHFVAQDFDPSEIKFDQQQGDDGAYATSKPEELKDHFRRYGVEVNDDKSYIANDYIIYLQNLYHQDYVTKDKENQDIIRGIYPTYRALLRIVYLERFNDISKEENLNGKDYFAIRTLSILENCKYHPLFEDFVFYVMSLDKYSLNASDSGIDAYVRYREKLEGKDVRFTEYKRGDSLSIKDFEAYKIVKSKQNV
jgi:hypothetical protein